jgi:hypothetical protein
VKRPRTRPTIDAVQKSFLAISQIAATASIVGLVLGLFTSAITLLGARPILRADRAVAYLMVPWFLIVVGYWVAHGLSRFLAAPILIALRWISFDWIKTLPDERYLLWFAWALAVITAIIGFINIAEDRSKMQPPAR